MSNPTIKINPNNWYHIHRREIYEFHQKNDHLQIGDAAMQYRMELGVTHPDGTADGIDDAIKEFTGYIRNMTDEETKDYFLN